jgi:hypothetical protein
MDVRIDRRQILFGAGAVALIGDCEQTFCQERARDEHPISGIIRFGETNSHPKAVDVLSLYESRKNAIDGKYNAETGRFWFMGDPPKGDGPLTLLVVYNGVPKYFEPLCRTKKSLIEVRFIDPRMADARGPRPVNASEAITWLSAIGRLSLDARQFGNLKEQIFASKNEISEVNNILQQIEKSWDLIFAQENLDEQGQKLCRNLHRDVEAVWERLLG